MSAPGSKPSEEEKPVSVTVKFEKRDLWLGVFWDWECHLDRAMSRTLVVYVCLIPCFPIIFRQRVPRG